MVAAIGGSGCVLCRFLELNRGRASWTWLDSSCHGMHIKDAVAGLFISASTPCRQENDSARPRGAKAFEKISLRNVCAAHSLITESGRVCAAHSLAAIAKTRPVPCDMRILAAFTLAVPNPHLKVVHDLLAHVEPWLRHLQQLQTALHPAKRRQARRDGRGT